MADGPTLSSLFRAPLHSRKPFSVHSNHHVEQLHQGQGRSFAKGISSLRDMSFVF